MIFWPESLLPGDSELLAQAANARECPTLAECSRSAIQHLAQCDGIDFATALIYDRILRQPANRDFFERVHCQPEVRTDDLPLIGLVPGAFYREHNNTGADGAEAGPVPTAFVAVTVNV